MMATVPHVTSGSGLRKFLADGFLFDCTFQNRHREGRICVLQVQQIMQCIREGLPKITQHTTKTVQQNAQFLAPQCMYVCIYCFTQAVKF
jgi:hypothetical protein